MVSGNQIHDKVKVEHKVSVAAFTSRDEKCVGEGREEDTTEERWEGERERRFRLKVTGKGLGGTRVAKCNVNLMKKWSEICSGCTRMLSEGAMEAQMIIIPSKCNQKYKPQRKFSLKIGRKQSIPS